jgi:hypothetical protein
MKKVLFTGIFLLVSMTVFSQAVPAMSRVAVLPFEAAGAGVSTEDAVSMGEQLAAELRSWGTLNLVNDPQQAQYVIRGQLERTNNQFAVSATAYYANRELNGAREQAATLADLSSHIYLFAARITENIPLPNYLLGKWQAVLNLDDGPLTCILEFKADRTIVVEQFDTWEKRGENSLRYQGFGTGDYAYWSHDRRTVQGKPVDGLISVIFRLEDSLTRYTPASYIRVNYSFNSDKSAFELVDSGFRCGQDFSSSSGGTAAYISFTKIP